MLYRMLPAYQIFLGQGLTFPVNTREGLAMTENERMTHKRASGIKTGYWSPNKKEELVQRLAAYEDTGLEPREIQALVAQGGEQP